ncbi:hypothetical protein Emtol_2928 [Emticicia oligotrophica DSM 17448]|uniref:Universal stress protein family protein n=2 Tax=Emticicia TaxID=312278 RepID=A0ABN4AQK6_EMTOG|nr:hypothetical protein Emtol_2928 [Emticicia oligotrophica DSM 17448]
MASCILDLYLYMTFFSAKDAAVLPSVQYSRNILIAIDLGPYSEIQLTYTLLLTKDFPCNYTVVHCMKENEDEIALSKKIDEIVRKASYNLSLSVEKKIVKVFSKNNLLATINEIHAQNFQSCVFVGTSNSIESTKMSRLTSQLLLQSDLNLFVIPPDVILSFPTNISILVETTHPESIEKLTGFNRYISHYNAFLNFVIFADNQDDLVHCQCVAKDYKAFFRESYTFTFVAQCDKSYYNFLKYIKETQCESVVIPWSSDSDFFRPFIENEDVKIPFSPKIPIFFSKRREPIEAAFEF